ncbi:GDP-mannose 4,6-dehydratase [Xanthomonas sacchari]|uniref:GDP-mannose 4,6-dehydratase n=1 Tax=Xanthomonas sacchari TaxID=56458 RepID=UPI000581F9BA|nr:GDP-mannose 4,6-dehydratase [Xanthomonas sacchari]AJC46011.1 GDP-6-deoxy-D-lyxo-4-hexulose reductase [Xanthomonas sacchari]
MNQTGERVLLTGAGGFTGRYMQAELLARGYDVVALVGAHADPSDGVRRVQVDLRDREGLARVVAEVRPHRVIHLAALAFVGHGSANDFYEVNLVGTRNLLEALAAGDASPERVLLASSANVYGNASEGLLDEQTPPAPANDYAVSKLAMEYAARLWSSRLPLVIARPFNYTGVGQAENFLIPKIVAHFRRRAAEVELGNLDVWRDFTDVRAVVEAYARLLAMPAADTPIANVCSGTAYSLREIVGACSELTGHVLDVRVNPAFVRANEVKTLRGDNRLLQRLIGPWQGPPLTETLRWMLSST